MVCGCIDIGSNTTRVLVADASDGRLREVLQRRAFTRIGKGLKPGAEIPRAKIEEVAAVVASHRELAEEAGAHPVRTVATAAIRSAANRDEFVEVVGERGGVEVSILEGEEEARLAFLGATRTLGHTLEGRVGVVDVGGGSTEIAVGTMEGGVSWWASFRLGSGHLADEHLRSDPPSAEEIAVMRAHAEEVFETIAVPRPAAAVAVGGSAASLRRLVGSRTLAEDTLQRALRRARAGSGGRGRRAPRARSGAGPADARRHGDPRRRHPVPRLQPDDRQRRSARRRAARARRWHDRG